MKREKNMYTVTYNYYNYASQSKSFDTYVAAKGFFNRINRDRRVRRVELIAPEKKYEDISDNAWHLFK